MLHALYSEGARQRIPQLKTEVGVSIRVHVSLSPFHCLWVFYSLQSGRVVLSYSSRGSPKTRMTTLCIVHSFRCGNQLMTACNSNSSRHGDGDGKRSFWSEVFLHRKSSWRQFCSAEANLQMKGKMTSVEYNRMEHLPLCSLPS
jgi:hypothetical protein